MNKQTKDKDLITTTAIKTYKIERETILNLTNVISYTFVAEVQHLYVKNGRLAGTGVGKSIISDSFI